MKKKIAVVLCAVGAALSLGLAAACAKDAADYKFNDYEYENQRNEISIADVTLDGKFDESFWSEKRWHSTDAVCNTNTWQMQDGVSVAMTMQFAEDGLLFGVQVWDDSFTYYSYGREFYGNSGIEVFLSLEPDLLNDNGGAWEIMVDGVGDNKTQKWVAGNVATGANFCAFPATVYSAASVNGGELNGTAESLSVELYVPYASLGITEKPAEVYVDYAYNRNRDENNSRDAFCDIAMYEMGAGWGSGAGWYRFNGEGLAAYDIEATVSAGEGTIETRGFAMSNYDEPVNVVPADGYYVQSLTVNGEAADALYLTCNDDGSVTYTVSNAAEDKAIEAKFAAYPTQTMSGTLTVNGAAGEVQLYAENGLSRKPLATIPQGSGAYAYTLPQAGTRIVASCDGFFDAAANLTAQGGDASIDMTALTYGGNENLGGVSETSLGDLSKWSIASSSLTGIIRSAATDNYVRAVYSEAFGEKVTVSADILLPQGAGERRVGFFFIDANGNSEFVCIYWKPADGTYSVQFIGNANGTWNNTAWHNTTSPLPEEYEELLAVGELSFTVSYEGGTYTVWLNGRAFTTYRPDWGAYPSGSVAAGLETWGYRGVYRNVGYEAAVEHDITVGENGTAEVTSAVFGGDFTVEMTPASGYSVDTLTINGRDYSTFGGYTVANEDGVVTVSFENWGLTHADVAVTFAQFGKTEVGFDVVLTDVYANDTTPAAEGMTVTLTGLRDGKEYIIESATDNRGHVDFGEVANGTYVLALDETGYNTYTVEVGGEIAAEYAFERALIATTNPNVDMSAADEGTIVYNANWCDEIVLRDIGGGEDFMISTVVSPFALVDGAPSYANMGFYALIGDGNNTNDNGNSANQVRGGIQISGNSVILKFNGDWWESYTLPQEYADAFAAGTLRIGFGRGQGVFFLAAGIDDGSGECEMTRFVNLVLLTSDITKNAIDELHMFTNGTAQVTLSRILFETGEDVPEIGRVTFNGEADSETPIGRTDTENYNVAANEDFFIGGRVEGLLLNTSGNDEGERWLGFSVWQAGKWEGWWATDNDTSGAHGALKDDGKGNIGLQWAGQNDGNWPWVDIPATREDLENGEVWFGFGRIDNKLFLCAWKEGGTKVFNIIPGDGSQMKKLSGALTLGKYAPNTRGTLLEVSFCTGSEVPALFDAEYTVNTPENGSVEVTSQSVAVGSELKIVATPESGYRVQTLTINGIAYTSYSGVQTQLDGETLTVTIPVWNASRADIEAAFKPIDYIAVTGAEDAANGTVAVSDRIEVGGDLVIEATPEEGYSFVSLTVNGKRYTEYAEYSIEYEGETATITLPAWMEKTAALAVTFEKLPAAEVSFTITLTDALAAQPPVAEGTAVLLKSSRTGAVLDFTAGADGKVDCGALTEGEYILSLAENGYNTFTLKVGEDLEPTYAFVRATVAAGENVAVDGAKVTISADNADAEIYRTAAAGENFMISAALSNYAASGTGDAIVGFYAFTGAGDKTDNGGNDVNKVQGGLYRKADGVYLQFVGSATTAECKLPEAYQEAFSAGTLRIALGRAQSVFFLAAAVGDGEYTRFVDLNILRCDLTRMGGFTLGLYNSGTENVTLSEVTFLTGTGIPLAGTMSFYGEWAEELAYGRTEELADYNVAAGDDFYIAGRVTGQFTNADGTTTGERKIGFAVWNVWENWWNSDADTSGVHGGIKVGNDGIAVLEWATDNGWQWPWTALPEGGQEAYENGELIFGFGRIGGNFFLCAGTSEEDMVFNILQTAGGKLSDVPLKIGKWCNSSNVRGALADVMFYTGEDVPVELPSA